ncbi:MAG: tetratricopeptide repeat protein [bacterium JZ-2024 1]
MRLGYCLVVCVLAVACSASSQGKQERPPEDTARTPSPQSVPEFVKETQAYFADPQDALNDFFGQPLEEIKKAPKHKLEFMVKLAMQLGDSPLQKPDDVIQRMDVILHLAPETRLAVIYKASALVRKGEKAEGLKVLGPVRAKLNELPLYAVMREVEVLLSAGALAEAEKDLRQTEKRAPNFLEARFLLSRVLYYQGKVEEAEARLKEDLTIFPKYAGGMIMLGEINEEKGNLKEAEEYYLQAEPYIKDSPLVAEKLTRLYAKMGKKERAKLFLKRYREHKKADPKVTRELTTLISQ